jgi:hypothetical protein
MERIDAKKPAQGGLGLAEGDCDLKRHCHNQQDINHNGNKTGFQEQHGELQKKSPFRGL